MQNTKNNLATQCVETSQEQLQIKLSKLTRELSERFGYQDLEPIIQNVLIGWLVSDYQDYIPKNERVETFLFFTGVLKHFQKTDAIFNGNKTGLFPLEIYDEIFSFDFKRSKKYFRKTMADFLQSEFSDDTNTRSNAVFYLGVMQKYIKKIQYLKLQERNKNQLQPK